MSTSSSIPAPPPVPASSVQAAVPLDNGTYRWEWENADTHTWERYDDATAALIELAYTQRVHSAQLTHGFFGTQGGYTIDLNTFVQIRNSSGFQRRLRRHPAVVPLAPGGAPAPPPSAFGGFSFGGAPPSAAKPIKNNKTPDRILCDSKKLTQLQAALQLVRNTRYDDGVYQREEVLFLDVDDQGNLIRESYGEDDA